MAIKACVRKGTVRARQFGNRLVEVVLADEEPDVRSFAAAALLSLAEDRHLPSLKEALPSEPVDFVRRRIAAVVRRLEGDPL